MEWNVQSVTWIEGVWGWMFLHVIVKYYCRIRTHYRTICYCYFPLGAEVFESIEWTRKSRNKIQVFVYSIVYLLRRTFILKFTLTFSKSIFLANLLSFKVERSIVGSSNIIDFFSNSLQLNNKTTQKRYFLPFPYVMPSFLSITLSHNVSLNFTKFSDYYVYNAIYYYNHVTRTLSLLLDFLVVNQWNSYYLIDTRGFNGKFF